MKNIAVVGYGVIGKRVADAIKVQDDMKLVGVCDVISDWRIQNAVRKDYDIYAATTEAEKQMKTSGILYPQVKLSKKYQNEDMLGQF